MQLRLPKLPFEEGELKDLFSREAIDLHYNRHHRAYVKKANELLKQTKQFGSIVDLLANTPKGTLFNNVAQAWNHCFLWHSLANAKSSKDQLEKAPNKTMLLKLHENFNDQATAHFGSGWCWIVMDGRKKLSVMTTHDGEVPFLSGMTPLVCCDLWEHAYYVDYQNERKEYVKHFWNHIHWDFLQKNLTELRVPDLDLLVYTRVGQNSVDQKRQYHVQTFS